MAKEDSNNRRSEVSLSAELRADGMGESPGGEEARLTPAVLRDRLVDSVALEKAMDDMGDEYREAARKDLEGFTPDMVVLVVRASVKFPNARLSELVDSVRERAERRRGAGLGEA